MPLSHSHPHFRFIKPLFSPALFQSIFHNKVYQITKSQHCDCRFFGRKLMTSSTLMQFTINNGEYFRTRTHSGTLNGWYISFNTPVWTTTLNEKSTNNQLRNLVIVEFQSSGYEGLMLMQVTSPYSTWLLWWLSINPKLNYLSSVSQCNLRIRSFW